MLRRAIGKIAALNRMYDELDRANPKRQFAVFVLAVIVPFVGLGLVHIIAQVSFAMVLLVARMAWIEGWIRSDGDVAAGA